MKSRQLMASEQRHTRGVIRCAVRILCSKVQRCERNQELDTLKMLKKTCVLDGEQLV